MGNAGWLQYWPEHRLVPERSGCPVFQPDGSSYDPDTISFIGRMDYYPNQECMFRFCEQIWPLLKGGRR
jgi:hypothetical protein